MRLSIVARYAGKLLLDTVGVMLGLVIAYAVFSAISCAAPITKPTPPPVDLNEKLARVEAVIDHCQRQCSYHLCETGPWIDALAAAGELYRAGGLCYADLAERSGADAVTLAEAKGKQAQAEQDRDSAKSMQWVWGAVGLVLGAAITAGAALWR